MENQSFDVAVVGHFAIDTIRLPSHPKPFVGLGGSVTYVSFVTKRLDGKVSIISNRVHIAASFNCRSLMA